MAEINWLYQESINDTVFDICEVDQKFIFVITDKNGIHNVFLAAEEMLKYVVDPGSSVRECFESDEAMEEYLEGLSGNRPAP